MFKYSAGGNSILYDVKDVMPDKGGEPCGIWYKNIMIPKAMNIKDSNQCMAFKRLPDIMVHVCSIEP